MTAIQTTVIGNLTDDAEMRFTPSGAGVASFTIACNERYRDGQSGEWKDGPTSFVRCNAWRDLAEHIVESLAKGHRVIASGVFRQRNYETKEGEKRTVWELAVSAIGPDLRYATAKVAKVHRDQVPPAEDPWASAPGSDVPVPDAPAVGFTDEPPF